MAIILWAVPEFICTFFVGVWCHLFTYLYICPYIQYAPIFFSLLSLWTYYFFGCSTWQGFSVSYLSVSVPFVDLSFTKKPYHGNAFHITGHYWFCLTMGQLSIALMYVVIVSLDKSAKSLCLFNQYSAWSDYSIAAFILTWSGIHVWMAEILLDICHERMCHAELKPS